ncbi:MAG: SpoIIE family protein phosphatase [Spirochaetales bacterium]|nr:SpoIIE family protein phosphatase [Spirochaetales bacterium]
MRLFYEWGTRQLNKSGEELCGDSIIVSRHADSVSLALSDGLGSGVKANILATLTNHIAMHMLENDLPLGEVVQTLTETLPVCRVRNLAYSTFAIAQFFSQGSAKIVQFDSPPVILIRQRKVTPVEFKERSIDGKRIHQTVINLQTGDWVVFVSDGVLNAGIGGEYPLGWGWENATGFMEQHAHQNLSADEFALKIAETVNELYVNSPGDDVSIVVLKVRQKQTATVLTGPPENKQLDKKIVKSFLEQSGQLIICGGTTAKIVSHYIGQPLNVDLSTMTPVVPPIAYLKGIDLVTEGILTLTRVNEMLKSRQEKNNVRFKTDGASDLLRLFLNVDHIHFIVGQAINPAHQNPELPHELDIRMAVVREIGDELKARGKEVNIDII